MVRMESGVEEAEVAVEALPEEDVSLGMRPGLENITLVDGAGRAAWVFGTYLVVKVAKEVNEDRMRFVLQDGLTVFIMCAITK